MQDDKGGGESLETVRKLPLKEKEIKNFV